jgi:16S rRNA (cytidine1402-2'-O)-methyltransferase
MLYIVGTSIGTIHDTSLRAAKILTQADIILAEDTRTFGQYFKKLQADFRFEAKANQRIISFHDQNEFQRIPEIIDALESGQEIALVSESGMPIISDPGGVLVQQLIKRSLPYTVIPGPSALTTALAHVGVGSHVFFVGFMPKKESQVRKTLKSIAVIPVRPLTIVAYESPYRLQATLSILNDLYPHADITICRELTKKFEQIIRGKPKDLLSKTFKGEITLVVQLLDI